MLWKKVIVVIGFLSLALTACNKDNENNANVEEKTEAAVDNIPQIIISEELANWVEAEDNGVIALTYYEVMKQDLGITEVHNEETYTDVAILSDGLALQANEILGEYGNKYSASALYEKAKEVNAEYIDVIEMDDMGDGTYKFYMDFGTSENTIYISETEAFIH